MVKPENLDWLALPCRPSASHGLSHGSSSWVMRLAMSM
jgi:hypothetical protein